MKKPDPEAWPEVARALYTENKGHSLHIRVLELLNDCSIRKVLVACSGGADSVFMLCQLWAQKEDLGIQLVVAHYNHCWRGEDSESDEEFVREMAHQLRCPFVTEARAENEPAMTETSARSLRIRFLRAAAGEYGCQCIAFGHQLDDILETQLQRLGRGSGVDGLAAPRPVHFFEEYPVHVRPLLHMRASTIRETLKENSIAWREDASNKNTQISRNALRHFVIPQLQDALKHDLIKGAARSRELLEEDAVALNQLAMKFLPEAFQKSSCLERSALRATPKALVRRALIAWTSSHHLSASLSAAAIEQLINAIYSEKEGFRLSAGSFFIVVDASTVQIESVDLCVLPLKPCSLKAGESATLSTGAILETEFIPVDGKLLERLSSGTVDVSCEAYVASAPGQVFQIRAREPGDFFQPLGAPGSKKLKDCLIDRKIPARERNLLPLVVTDSGTILWVPGLPPSQSRKINAKTKMALKLTYNTRKSSLAI